ncbi:MAG: Ig-like domain-containing protein, partial [Geminicoccales bacterium]
DEHGAFDLIFPNMYLQCDGTPPWGTLSFFDRHAKALAKHGLQGKAGFGLSIGRNNSSSCPRPSVSEFEKQLKYARKVMPFAAHMFLYTKSSPSSSLLKSYLAAIKREFFDKAPTASIKWPGQGQTVGRNSTVTISASGKANGTTRSPIDHYRFFVENELVAVQESPSYTWHTGSETGKVTLTVHAVAGDYLAGAAQAVVTIGSGGSQPAEPPPSAEPPCSCATQASVD